MVCKWMQIHIHTFFIAKNTEIQFNKALVAIPEGRSGSVERTTTIKQPLRGSSRRNRRQRVRW